MRRKRHYEELFFIMRNGNRERSSIAVITMQFARFLRRVPRALQPRPQVSVDSA